MTSIDQDALTDYDALTDTPIPSFYRQLDNAYPGSKFILTIRDMEGWLKSCKKQFNQKSANKQSEAHNQLFLDLYSTTVFDEEKFKQSYLDFVHEVKTYFKDRPEDLLILDVIGGEGWEKLCPFLDKAKPEAPFPKSNVTSIRWLNIHELAQSVRHSALPMYQLTQSLTANETSPINKIKYAIHSLFAHDNCQMIEKSASKTQTSLTKELFRLNADIPVMSKTFHDIPLESRRSWNHFWLISTSEGNAQSERGGVGYIINLALIEDGLPFLGIIYLPEIDALYYAALDKGAFKTQGDKEPVKIDSASLKSQHSAKQNTANTEPPSSQMIASFLCQSIETDTAPQLLIDSSKEWQTAAAHAVLKTLGYSLIDKTSQIELKYNKQYWDNPAITLESSVN